LSKDIPPLQNEPINRLSEAEPQEIERKRHAQIGRVAMFQASSRLHEYGTHENDDFLMKVRLAGTAV
jgi:hypothetical protein